MKIIFFGTSEFTIALIEAILRSTHQLLAVVTAADKARGRTRKLFSSPVKLLAEKKGVMHLEPETLNEHNFVKLLKELSADIFVVCDFGKIFPQHILQLPKIYSINLHTSILPKYRGAAPINWAIINGEKKSGLTVFRINENIDQGEIILQHKVDIHSDETSIDLKERLSKLAVDVVLKALDLIANKKAILKKQNENQVSFAPKLKKGDGLIDWRLSALEIHNRIRGLQPWPGAFSYLNGKLLKLFKSEVFVLAKGTIGNKPGEIVAIDQKKGILIETGNGRLLVSNLQLEGKRRMSSSEFLSGHNIKLGEILASRNHV